MEFGITSATANPLPLKLNFICCISTTNLGRNCNLVCQIKGQIPLMAFSFFKLLLYCKTLAFKFLHASPHLQSQVLKRKNFVIGLVPAATFITPTCFMQTFVQQVVQKYLPACKNTLLQNNVVNHFRIYIFCYKCVPYVQHSDEQRTEKHIQKWPLDVAMKEH